jgi:RNA recognition motif-containing protein
LDPETNQNRGFGFITMSTSQEADDCIKNLQEVEFFGNKLSIEKVKLFF